MKKIFAMLASVVMASTMIATTAFAADKAAADYWGLVNTNNVTELNAGDTVTLNLQSLLAKKAIGEIVVVWYDSNAVECVDIEDVDGISYNDTEEDAAFTLSSSVAFSGAINADSSNVSFNYANAGGTDKSMKANEDFAFITFKAKEVSEDTVATFTVWHQASGTNASKGDIDSATVTITVKAAAGDDDEPEYGTAGNDFEGKATKYWKVDFAEWTGTADVSLTDGTTTKTINVTTAEGSEDYVIGGAVSFYVYVIGNDIANVYIVE